MSLIESLQVQNVRGLDDLSLLLGNGVNVFWGANGAGKTSILEAVNILSYGRSFVTANTRSVIRFGSESLTVFAKVLHKQATRRVALQVSLSQERRVRVDGKGTVGQAPVSRIIPVLTMAPGGVDLVFDGPGDRRRFMDWGAFHFGGGSSNLFSAYRRVVAQRNSVLRNGILDEVSLAGWDVQLAGLGESIDGLRQAFVISLRPAFAHYCEQLGLGLDLTLEYSKGWVEGELANALYQSRSRDRRYRVSTRGPHRADLLICRDGNKVGDVLSRGQAKIVNLALLFAQVELAKSVGATPVLCLDDPGAELDQDRLEMLWDQLDNFGIQSLVTGLTPSRIGLGLRQSKMTRSFHVKRGQILHMRED